MSPRNYSSESPQVYTLDTVRFARNDTDRILIPTRAQEKPTLVLFEDPDVYREHLQHMYDEQIKEETPSRLGRWMFRLLDPSTYDPAERAKRVVAHEADHATAAARFSLTTRFYINYSTVDAEHPYATSQITAPEDNFYISKLAVASIYAHPYDTKSYLEGDVYDLRAIGYRGIQDVGGRIFAHNRANPNNTYPLPKTYNPATGRVSYAR